MDSLGGSLARPPGFLRNRSAPDRTLQASAFSSQRCGPYMVGLAMIVTVLFLSVLVVVLLTRVASLNDGAAWRRKISANDLPPEHVPDLRRIGRDVGHPLILARARWRSPEPISGTVSQ